MMHDDRLDLFTLIVEFDNLQNYAESLNFLIEIENKRTICTLHKHY